jgi:hypothetical protein
VQGTHHGRRRPAWIPDVRSVRRIAPHRAAAQCTRRPSSRGATGSPSYSDVGCYGSQDLKFQTFFRRAISGIHDTPPTWPSDQINVSV